MDKQIILLILISAAIYFMMESAKANETVTILEPDGNIQICKVTDSGVIVCL